MANIERQKFQILDVTGSNYLVWRVDIELHLQGLGLEKTLENVDIALANKRDEANAIIFIRYHLSDDLKDEYIQIKRPCDIWQRLDERFGHARSVALPQAQYDWQHLRLQDFKSVAEYNSALFKIESRLSLCGTKLSEYDKLEKTFSTMHASNVVLQQQYRQRQFKMYSELISVLLMAEKTNELLLRNHDLRPSGSQPVPETHASSSRTAGRSKDHEYKYRRGAYRCRGRGNYRKSARGRGHPYRHDQTIQSRQPVHKRSDHDKTHTNEHSNSVCYRCGMTGHWSRICRTAPHLVELYQASRKKGKNVQAQVAEAIEPLFMVEANTSEVINNQNLDGETSLQVLDFLNDPDPGTLDADWWKYAQT